MNLKTKLILLLVMIFNISLFAQGGYQISGTVVDGANMPIPGVNVIVDKTTKGTATDFDGKFQLQVNNGDILNFSYVGYVKQSITVTGQTTLNVVMEEDASKLEEVVVVGYGTRKKSHLTGAIAKIGGEDVAAVQAARVDDALSAKALLAKVYLTLGRKSEALPLLTDIITNSGYGLESTYANVFSITNELNKEILFTIRYKSGIGGLGSPFTTSFAPATPTRDLNGTPIIVVSNQGDNAPGQELYDSFNMADARRNFILPSRDASTPQKLFYTKYWYSLSVRDDSEFDFPIIRYADVLLMYAEAAGSSDPNTLTYMNRVRARVGLTGANALTSADIDTPAEFDLALSNERRWEFMAENHRWYDILRYDTTLSTLNAVDIMENHFRVMQPLLYSFYSQNTEDVTLDILLERVDENSLLLPIPQIELDLDTDDDFNQNPGYN